MFTVSAYCQQSEVPYKGASSWAIAELNEAEKHGLITDKIKEKMNSPITRGEFAELAVRLYEVTTGKKAVYGVSDEFSDTENVEIFKAYNLQIVKGTNIKENLFSPDYKTDREQVAAMLYRTIKAIKADEDFSTDGVAKFLDEKEVSSWAMDSLKYMNKHGYLLGSEGKIKPKDLSTREMAVLIANRIYKKYAVVDTTTYPENNDKVNDKNYTLSDKAVLVINDFDIASENYRIIEKEDSTYIFVAMDKFKYGFKIPYAGYYSYPDVLEADGVITVAWKNEEGVVLKIEMTIDSLQVQINGTTADIGIGPYREGGKTFIPINLFMAALEMNLAEESTEDIILMQYKEDFPAELLVGSWTDIDTDLFTHFKDITSGAVSLSSYASAYIFDKDGTYKLRMASVGGFNDTFIMQSGKYKIMGNTIMYYDIVETLYKGRPFMLSYENKHYAKPHYDFINNYNAEEDKIEIGGFWLNRKK